MDSNSTLKTSAACDDDDFRRSETDIDEETGNETGKEAGAD